jgi:hypothetical protein
MAVGGVAASIGSDDARSSVDRSDSPCAHQLARVTLAIG